MSLIVTALIVGAGALVAGAAAGWATARRREAPEPAAAPAKPAATPVSPLRRAGFEVELGDVVEVAGRELWLERGWLLSEGGDPVAAVLSASEATVLVLPPPASTVFLLDPVELSLGDEPPASVESRGVRFERARRLPVAVSALGKSPALPWDEALLAEYRGLSRDVLWVLGRGGRFHAWQGRAVEESEIVRWGGGSETLE